ncbi:MAG: hypothetical protein KBT12_01800 [Bacteroidales bacterium]|nr:hypothetical protein [Candidatus Physcousia equi]
MNLLKHHILLAICLLLLLGACADDTLDEQTGAETTAQGACRVALKLATRADGQPKDAVSDVELMQNYRVIITDVNGKIVRSIDGVCTPAAELDPVETSLNIGTYYAYGFANLSKGYLDGLGLTEGKNISDNLSAIRFFMPAPFSSTQLLSADKLSEGIPMTSAKQMVKVEGPNQTFGIEVRRLMAKLEFEFSNPTPYNMQIASQSINNMTVNASDTEGSILLMNYQTPNNTLDLAPNAVKATLKNEYQQPVLLKAGAKGVKRVFYVLESEADNITRSFMLNFDVRSAAHPADEDFRYALTNPEVLPRIHRNDWIHIPISLGEWQMRLEARSYPPIGGYPEAEFDQTESNEFVVIFDGGGECSIRPFIRQYGDPTGWFGLDSQTRISGEPVITLDDPDHLFLSEPELDKSGEIRGVLDIAPGTFACITLTADVFTSTPDTDTPAERVTKRLTRKIYVTQKAK